MSLFKNIASQKVRVFCWDATTGLPKTGDAANITASVSKDFGAFADLTDTSASEEDSAKAKGYYLFDISQTETNADDIAITGRSTTSNIVVVGAPARMATRPSNAGALAISSAGGVTLADAVSHGGTLGSSTATLAVSRLSVVSQSSNTAALTVTGNGTGDGATLTGGATGNALELTGGGTSGDGLKATTTSGHGMNITATGTAKHGISTTGAAASGANAAGVGLKAVGGAASTTSGGTAGQGVHALGGAGAASTNGAASGVRGEGGGTTTVTGGRGMHLVGTGSLADLGCETNGITASITGTLSTVTTLTNAPSDSSGVTTLLSRIGGAITISGGKVATTLAASDVTGNVAADLQTIKSQAVTCAGGVTVPAATLASTTNITAGTITTVTTVTNQLTAAAIATGVWQDTTAGDFTTASSIGRSLFTSGVVPGAAGGLFIAGTNAATTITTALTTTFTGNLTGSVTVGTNNDKTGYSISGTKTTLDALNDITAAAVWAAGTRTLTASLDPTSAVIAAAVWDLATSGHTSGGTFGAAMNAAGSAGDPWGTALPGTYGAGTAGFLVGSNLNAAVSSRSTYAGGDTSGTTTLLTRLTTLRAGYLDNLSGGAVVLAGSAPSWYVAPVDVSANVVAIKAKTDNLPAAPADETLLIAATNAVMARLGAPAGASLAADIATRLATSGYTAAPTVAAIATGVWQDTTAGDFTVAGSIGKSLFTSGAVPGAAGGLFIAGTNAATTITTALTTTFTGSLIGSVGSVTAPVTVGTNSDKAGYSLATAGLDTVHVETGLNARQALAIIASACAGVLSGASGTDIAIAAAGVPATNRIAATVDGDGNRTAVTLTPPA